MTERVLNRVKGAHDDELTYEAQQQLKTIYHRLRSRQKFQEAYDLLYKGCTAHIANAQVFTLQAQHLTPVSPHVLCPCRLLIKLGTDIFSCS